MKFLKSLAGIRTAIMAFVLVAEVVAKGLGFEAGPVFAFIYSGFSAMDWDPKSLGFDPVPIGAAVVTIWLGALRVKAWWEKNHEEKPLVR